MELVRKEAKKNVAAKKAFYVHFGVYVIVILFLALINLLTLDDGGREWWFFYPLLGWGVGVSIHYLTVFGFPGTDILTKEWEAEEMVRRTSLEWTIFRPSLIYGPGDQFINMLAQLIKTLPVVPVMGDGRYQLQPVHVTDVAAGFVQALEKQETIGKTYQCCGSQVFSYDQLLDAVAQGLGRGSGVRKIHQPLWLMKPVVAAMQSIPQFPMTSDQLQMLLEGNICSDSCWQDDLCLEIHDFPSSIRAYLQK